MVRSEILALNRKDLNNKIAEIKNIRKIVPNYVFDLTPATMELVEEMGKPLAFWKRSLHDPKLVFGKENIEGWYVIWCPESNCLAYHIGDAACAHHHDVWAETLPEAIGKAYLLGFVDWAVV